MAQKQYGHITPSRSNEDDKGIVASDMQGRVERGGTVQDKRKLRGNLINMYEYLVGGIRKIQIQIFSVLICERTRSNRHELKYREFYLDIVRENFFTEVAEHKVWE